MSNPNLRPVILAADDDEDARFLLARAFTKAVGRVSLMHVNDGSEVVGYLSGEGKFTDRADFPLPDLLLLDLKMPKLSGFGVLEYLRAQPQFKGLPVLVLSSSAEERDVRKAYAMGCHSYIVKPGDFNNLIQLAVAIQTEFFEEEQKPNRSGWPASNFSRLVVPAEMNSNPLMP